MLTEINNLLDITCNSQNPLNGKCFFIAESKTEGAVFLHHFISMYLKNNNGVCIVALANIFGHYNNIGNKLGVNLSAARDSGLLSFVDAMKLSHEALSGSVLSSHPMSCLTSNADLKPLYDVIKQQLKTLADTTKPTLLVVDDVSLLLSLGLRPQAILIFLTCLRQLALQRGYCLLLLQRCDEDVEDEDGQLVKHQLCHFSDTIIRVQALSSGFSKDVHGEVEVIQRNVEQEMGREDTRRTMQYTLTDRGIKLFAKGMSAAVL